MKRFLAGFVTAAVLFSVAPSFAQETIRLVVNGQEIMFVDAPPQMINGRVMVPARPLAEALGGNVSWNADTRSVVVKTIVYEEQKTTLQDEYVFVRNLAIEYKWTAGQKSDSATITRIQSGNTWLDVDLAGTGDITGITSTGCIVRAQRIGHTFTLNQTDLKACGFIP